MSGKCAGIFRKSGPSLPTNITFSVPLSQVNYIECGKRKSTLFIPNPGGGLTSLSPEWPQTQGAAASSGKITDLFFHYITAHQQCPRLQNIFF